MPTPSPSGSQQATETTSRERLSAPLAECRRKPFPWLDLRTTEAAKPPPRPPPGPRRLFVNPTPDFFTPSYPQRGGKAAFPTTPAAQTAIPGTTQKPACSMWGFGGGAPEFP